MKKSLKIALSSLALVPCAFLFVGCGQDQLATEAKVNTTGNYQAASQQQFDTYVAKDDVNVSLNGYRFTMKATATSTLQGSVETTTNGIIKKTANGGVEAAFKVTAGSQTQMSMYIKDGYVYMEAEAHGNTIKTKTKMDVDKDFLEDLGQTGVGDVQEIMNSLKKMGKLDIQCSVEGNLVKYHFSTDEVDLSQLLDMSTKVLGSNFNCYFVFDNNMLTGAKLTFNYKTSSFEHLGDASISSDITMEKYNGKINFPKLDGYTEASL